jgi:hypothetical protein
LRQIQAVCALTGVEDQIGKIEPPRGSAQAFERLRELTDKECRLECRASLNPRTAIKRLIAGKAFGWSWRKHWLDYRDSRKLCVLEIAKGCSRRGLVGVFKLRKEPLRFFVRDEVIVVTDKHSNAFIFCGIGNFRSRPFALVKSSYSEPHTPYPPPIANGVESITPVP